MKKVLIGFLIIGLFILFGCTQLNSLSEKDCGSDWNCFYDKLTYCEPAKATFNSVIQLGHLKWDATIDTYHFYATTNGSQAEIVWDDAANSCYVNITNLQLERGILDTNSAFNEIKFKEYVPVGSPISKAQIIFETCEPNQATKCTLTVSMLKVSELR